MHEGINKGNVPEQGDCNIRHPEGSAGDDAGAGGDEINPIVPAKVQIPRIPWDLDLGI